MSGSDNDMINWYQWDDEELGERLENFTEFQQKKFEAELEALQKESEDEQQPKKVKKKPLLN